MQQRQQIQYVILQVQYVILQIPSVILQIQSVILVIHKGFDAIHFPFLHFTALSELGRLHYLELFSP